MTNSFRVGGFNQHAADIDADGLYLYLSVIDDAGSPEVLKMPADLSDVALSVYQPGDGASVNVLAGDLTSYFCWAVGDFGGYNRVILTEDGSYWYQKNPDPFVQYWYGVAGPAVIGPGEDTRLMVCVNDDFALHETYFVGDALYWFTEPAVPTQVGAVDRLDYNPDEVLVGAWYATYWYSEANIVFYSPSAGQVWGDVSFGLTGVAVTNIIFG